MRVKIVGICEVDRDGKKSTTLYYVSDFADYQKANSIRCEGHICESEWVRDIDFSTLAVGDTVELMYSKGYQGKAKLAGFKKIASASTSASTPIH